MNIEILSVKNILWILFGVACGYFLGWGVGMLLGTIIWTFLGVAFGGLIYHSTNSILVNAVLSVTFGVLLSLLVGAFDKRLFGGKTSPAIWMSVGAVLGVIVMFSYGINFMTHPEDYRNYLHLFPGVQRMPIEIISEPSPSYDYMLHIAYGIGTGRFIGLYLGLFAGMLISIRETLGRKRRAEDKQEFDEYSNFFKEHLKK
jgi:hypothetical protein